jgi:hypothetical protein
MSFENQFNRPFKLQNIKVTIQNEENNKEILDEYGSLKTGLRLCQRRD